LWYIKYSKEDAKVFLEKEFGWQYYGGHHLENRMTSFFHSIYCPQKFHIDYRNNSLSASTRAGNISREDAINEYYHKSPYFEPELLGYFKKRLNLTDDEYTAIMNKQPKYWYEFPTYKKRFEKLKPFFYILMKASLVPRSFYMKYCYPSEINKK